ncbi:MAG TPA: thioesterase family protein [Phototrophicaceae bacterium]|nr:thioesterase family protein [Phototrophicaceae bacterium]
MPAPNERYMAETTFYVRYAETDAMGIVHHSNYLVYFEEGRSHYSRERGHDYASFERSGRFLAVSEVNVRYIKPARYADRITVRCWLGEMKSRALTFEYEIVHADTGDLLITGQTRHVCITHDGQVTKIPDTWRGWAGT